MMSPEAKAAQSEKMKAAWAKRKAAKEVPADPAIQEAMALVPMNGVAEKIDRWTGEPLPDVKELQKKMTETIKRGIEHPSNINIEVDWDHLPMPEAQQFYAHLKSEFEKAGRILNARSMARISGYTCFMCKNHFEGDPKFTDHSYVDIETGLSPRVDCCGELCLIKYNAMRINQRHELDMKRAEAQRG
jgi:hypothetical protein